MPKKQPGEFPPELAAAVARRRLAGVERHVLRWLESEPSPEHRQHVVALILGQQAANR